MQHQAINYLYHYSRLCYHLPSMHGSCSGLQVSIMSWNVFVSICEMVLKILGLQWGSETYILFYRVRIGSLYMDSLCMAFSWKCIVPQKQRKPELNFELSTPYSLGLRCMKNKCHKSVKGIWWKLSWCWTENIMTFKALNRWWVETTKFNAWWRITL